MRKGYTDELGELQQRILKHIFECTSKSENASHIAKSLGLAQPTVFKSIKSLLQENYLESQQKAKRTEKTLTLTDKGAATAVVTLGATFDQFENHYKRQRHSDIQMMLQLIKRIFKTPEKRDLFIKKSMEYAFKNKYFEGTTIRQLTEEESKKFKLYMAIEYINSLPSTSNVHSLKEFIDRYQLDREIMKEYLNKQKQFADLLLKELDK
jgi:DNA-binding MarR family transcriptional regulator